jgi:hypothetical protein
MGLFVDLLLLGVILTRRSCVGCKDSSHEVNGRVGRDHQHDFASMEINHSHENDEMAHRHLHEATDDNDGMTHRHLHERADGNGKNGECGFIPPTPEEAKRDEKRMRLWRLGRGSSASKFDYRIPTYVHVLLPSATEDIVPEANVATYMSYLNAAFASSTPFVFNLMDVTRTVNQNWSNNCNNGTIETAFKTMLRRGGKESLNIYICNKSYAGYSYSPSQNSGIKDGVVLERTNPTDLRRPNTLVHEVVCTQYPRVLMQCVL